MKRTTYFLALALAASALWAWSGGRMVADEPAKVAGAWDLAVEGPQGTFNQSLTLEQDGATIKGTLKGRRGESPVEGTVTGNKLTFTVKRDTPNGTFTMEYSGTIDGDSMKGTVHSERFDGNWTAKRASATTEK